MDVAGKIVVVTGGGSGIGAAMARRFAAEGARAVVVSDRDGDAAASVAGPISARVHRGDVTDPAAVNALVATTVEEFGAVDLFCSNAGIMPGVGLDDPADLWHTAFDVNVMAHVYAARAVVPHMLARGSGWLLNTASAAGLLTAPGDAAYAASKHAAVAFAEWLSVSYAHRGVGTSVLCPLGVATPLLLDPLEAGDMAARATVASGDVVSPEHVASVVIEGLAQETFLILPHPEVATFWAQKASDPDRWLAGVCRLVAQDGVSR
jgi:NAD(P)-dependent dehydrogenase (short-subunit alcohol dehydrogenase family)